MKPALDKLLEISSPSIDSAVGGKTSSEVVSGTHLRSEISSMLHRKNGFFAFESSLHFLPMNTTERAWGLSDWNGHDLWKSYYGGLASDIFCFAADIFGSQFCVHKNAIYLLDVETGGLRWISDSLEAWAKELLSNYNELCGWSFARDWQRAHGAMKDRERLYPVKPFVLGGEYDVVNFRSLDSAQIMRNAGNVARQIANLPDGDTVELAVVSRR